MSTPEKEPIPESFREWADNYVNKIDLDGHPNIRSHVQAEVGVAIMDVYRHLSSQKATPSDGSETEDEKNYRKLSEWYLKQLRECQDELRTIKSSQPSPGLPWIKADILPKRFVNVIAVTNQGHFIKTCVDASGSWDTYELEAYEGEFITHYFHLSRPEETPSVQPVKGESLEDKYETLLQDGMAYLVDPAFRPDSQPIADKEVPTFYCHEIDSRGKDVCAEQCDMCEEYDKAPGQLTKAELIEKLNTDLSTQAIQIAGLLASNKEWGEKYEAVEKEMRTDAKFRQEMYYAWVEGAATVNDYTPHSAFPYADIFNIWFDKRYPSPTPTDSP